MITETERTEYLDEIRQEVCSRCVERPAGGPPCAPLGKNCGVEMHLEDLIDSIHQMHSPMLQPYLNHNRRQICEKCAFLHSSICPCPMDYLAALIVQAVETVDQRRNRSAEEGEFTEPESVTLEEIERAFEEAAGSWTGCDWPTQFGKTGLNLNGWTTAQATGMALETMDAVVSEDWSAAATWLSLVEHHARQAQAKAASALEAVRQDRWEEALHFAEWAWALEFATGRPFRRGFPLTWQPFRQRIETAYLGVPKAP